MDWPHSNERVRFDLGGRTISGSPPFIRIGEGRNSGRPRSDAFVQSSGLLQLAPLDAGIAPEEHGTYADSARAVEASHLRVSQAGNGEPKRAR